MMQTPHDPARMLRWVRAQWRRREALPAVIPLAGVVLALVAAVLVAELAASRAKVVLAVELPERAPSPTWEERVTRFAERLQAGFGIPASTAREFAPWILEASARQELAPEVVASLIYTESSFRKRVRSRAGAVGPAQVKPGFWRAFCGGVDLHDPEANVQCGAQVLAHYLDACGAFACAVRLYNVGPGNYANASYRNASDRYFAKIDRHRGWLDES